MEPHHVCATHDDGSPHDVGSTPLAVGVEVILAMLSAG